MTEQVRAIRLRPTLSTVLDSATNSDGEIFFDSNNQTLRIFDNGTGALVATRTWTTSSISTAIAAIPAVDLTGLATETYVDDAIAAIPAVDLTGLATETYVDDAIAATDPEYNNGAIIDLTGDGSNFFSREVTVNGVRIVAAGTVGGQTAVPDAFVEKVARMFELFTDPNGAGINKASQRTFIKTLSGDAGTYHAAVGPTLQRVARGAGADYTPNFLTDAGIASYNLSPLFDSHVANDMVWYLNSTGDPPGDGDNDAQEVIEHVFHTLHMHGLDAVSLKMYSYISADWASGPLYAAMEEAYDAGKWDSSGYGGNAWKTDGDAFEVAAKEYLFLLNFGMFEYSSLWDGGSLAPEWTDDMRTQSGIQTNNPLGYALHNTYIAPVISKPSLTTIRNIFQDGDVGDPTIAGVSGYVVTSGLATETYVDAAIAAIPAVDLTGLATETYVGTAISNLIDTAPTTLDTLNELAAALGDDANFAGTVTTSLGLKAPLESPVFTGTVTIPLSTEVVTPPFHPAHLAPAAIVEYRSSDDPFVGSTGTVTDTRGVVYHTIDDSAGAANWTANFSSLLLPTTAWSSKSFAIVCSQGSTNAWLPTAVQIGGAAQTIQWQGNIPPTGTVNGVDIISFTFIRRASDWLVLGSGTSYS
jgi:hypothetical protein